MKMTNLRALLRYNFAIVWGHTPWLVAIPVAASMLVLFWRMALASMFAPSQAAQTTESVAPILAAFLCAHLLGVEYRHHIEEITFSKPYAGRRIVYLRLLAVYVLIAFLVAVMLFVYAKGMGASFPVAGVVLAGIPSIFFLSMLSLMVATLFRQPAVGILAAGLYWAADAYGNVELHPLLSLQGYAAFLRMDDLSAWWLPGKLLLLALGVALYLVNVRLIGRPQGIRTRAKSVRNAAILLAAAFLYLYTGALSKIAYGLQHEREWPNQARVWYRERFQIYGSIPAARIVGASFADYVGSYGGTSEDESGRGVATGRTPRDLARLRRLTERAPQSRWADHALYDLARAAQAEAKGMEPSEARSLYYQLAERYPRSAFAPSALQRLGALSAGAGDAHTAEWAQQRLIERYPASEEAAKAVRALSQAWSHAGRHEDAVALVEGMASRTLAQERPALWRTAGDLLAAAGRQLEARERYQRALSELDTLLAQVNAELDRHEDIPPVLMERRNQLNRQRRETQRAITAAGG